MAAAEVVRESASATTMVYLPRSGGSRTIEAIVEYPGPDLLNGLRGGSRPHLEILVDNDDTTGISSRELDTGGDKAQLSLRRGRTVKTVRLVELLAQDRAMLRILAY
jgi:hypothetical protein